MLSVSRNRRSNWNISVYFRRVIPGLVNSVMKAPTKVQNLLSFFIFRVLTSPAVTKWLMWRQASCVGVTEPGKGRSIFSHTFFFLKWGKPFPEISLVHHTLGPINPWARKNPWSRKWQPTPIFFLGKFHGQRSLADRVVHGVSKNWPQLRDWAWS